MSTDLLILAMVDLAVISTSGLICIGWLSEWVRS
jgi:hypothetical protein